MNALRRFFLRIDWLDASLTGIASALALGLWCLLTRAVVLHFLGA